MKVDTYKSLVFDEDERIANPDAYFKSGTSKNRKIQHVLVNNRQDAERVLETLGLEGIVNDRLSFSILWNLPRKEYSETSMWVTVSGFTCGSNPPFVPNTFCIASNVVSQEDQKRALDLIDNLNTLRGIEVEYQQE